MKRIKSYISYCLLAAIICMAYSCSGFDEINTNPDSATTATPGMLATGQLKEALRIGGKSDPNGILAICSLQNDKLARGNGRQSENPI